MDGRQHYRGCAILTVMLVSFSLQTAIVISQDCTYLYIEQPPDVIDCNPFLQFRGDEVVSFRCALTAPNGSNVTLNWYHNGSLEVNGTAQKPTETNNDGTDTFRSFFTLTDPQVGEDDGEYYCQAVVDGGNLLPSKTFTLINEYINNRECLDRESDIFFASATKCADVLPTTESVTTPSTPTPQPSQSTLPTTLPTSQTTTSQHPLEGTPSTDPNGDPVSEPLQVWIYVLVGVAAVFGMIIVILTIMCVGLCLKRNKTVDSQTLKRTGGTGLTVNSMVPNEMYNSTENSIAAPPQYSSLIVGQHREYEVIGFPLNSHREYSHLHRPSPPPLPSTLPNGRSATMTERFQSTNTLTSEPDPEFSPAPTLPPKGTVPDHHVYRELENPVSCSLNSSTPPSAHMFERGDSTAQLLPGSAGPFSKANGGPYRKYSSDSATLSVNESLYSPTTPVGSCIPASGLEDIPETGMTFVEPDDPSAFPVHEYEVIPAPKRKTKNYESPVPDGGHPIGGNPLTGGHPIGGNPQTRASVKSANYETDPQLEVKSSESTARGINPYDSTCHFSASSADISKSSASREFMKVGEPAMSSPTLSSPPTQTGGLASDYSQLNFKDGNYSKLGSRNGETFDADFFKNASEICLSSNGINSHGSHFSNSNGSSTLYDSDPSSGETSPLPNASRGRSVPLGPPPVYPAESKYNQLTMPGFQSAQYPVCVDTNTTM